MKVIYYSEMLNKSFETPEELESAEKVEKEKLDAEAAKKAKRTEAAKDVEEKYRLANEALKVANEALKNFNDEYGAFHTTIKDAPSTSSLVDALFNSFFF